jgi:hypothetical protein
MEGYSFGDSARFASNLFYGVTAGQNLLGTALERRWPVGEGWHVYDMYWRNQNGAVTVRVVVDGAERARYSNADHGDLRLQNFGPHNIILNVAVGSNFGIFDNSRIDLQGRTMIWIDYVYVDRRAL